MHLPTQHEKSPLLDTTGAAPVSEAQGLALPVCFASRTWALRTHLQAAAHTPDPIPAALNLARSLAGESPLEGTFESLLLFVALAENFETGTEL